MAAYEFPEERMSDLPVVEIWTDGACEPNPGPGGWAALLIFATHEVELSGGEKATTNNRMEMQGAISALEAIGYPAKVRLHSDSQYLVKGMSEWMPKWLKRGLPETNRDLWQALLAWERKHQIEWRWVRGHSGVENNERVDKLAYRAIMR